MDSNPDVRMNSTARPDCVAIATHEKRRRIERGAGRCALVVDSALDFGISRMIEALREAAFEASQVAVFEDENDARGWLAPEGPG